MSVRRATCGEDHRATLERIGRAHIAALSRLSDGPGLVRLGAHLALVTGLAAVVLASEGWARLLAQAAMGVPLVFLFTALHEATHNTAFASRRMNGWVARGLGALLIVPATEFRCFHLAHHRHTQDPEHDPELSGGRPVTRAGYLWHLTGLPYWRGVAAGLATRAAGRTGPWVPPSARVRVVAEARWHLALYGGVAAASLATGSTLALTLWAVPLLLGQPWLRAYLMAEHTACPLVPDMLANTRTTYCHRAIRWIAWEMPWHTAHHAAPTVPFHRLAELSALMEADLASTATGYPHAHCQIRARLRRRPS